MDYLKSSDLSSAALCRYCRLFSVDIVDVVGKLKLGKFVAEHQSVSSSETILFDHYERYADLATSMKTCHSCRLFHTSLIKAPSRRLLEYRTAEVDVVSWHQMWDGDAGGKFFITIQKQYVSSSEANSHGHVKVTYDRLVNHKRNKINWGRAEINRKARERESRHVRRGIGSLYSDDKGSTYLHFLGVAKWDKAQIHLYEQSDSGLGIADRLLSTQPDWNLCRKLIQRCGDEHQDTCPAIAPKRFPLRIINIGTESDDNSIRLMESVPGDGYYLTISHRWGKSSQSLTTKANIDSRKEGFSIGELPVLLADAVRATRALGYRYIWIDTVCIVQDDPSDWEQHCFEMATIYQNAVCNIAAGDSPDSSFKLCQDRKQPIYHPLGPYTADNKTERSTMGLMLLADEPYTLMLMRWSNEWGRLRDRGWVLQEAVMAPRTLVVLGNIVSLHCLHGGFDERFNIPMSAPYLDPETSQLTADYTEEWRWWYWLVERYNSRNLSFASDKLPAFAGIARFFLETKVKNSPASGNGIRPEYWAGLWSNDMGRGLVWTSNAFREPEPFEYSSFQTYSSVNESVVEADPDNNDGLWGHKVDTSQTDVMAPSWSWASQSKSVNPWSIYDNFTFECISCDIVLAGENKFGRVKSAALVLRGKSRKAVLIPATSGFIMVHGLNDYENKEIAWLTPDPILFERMRKEWDPKKFPEAVVECVVFCLGLRRPGDTFLYTWFGLVLMPAGEGRFRRMGLCSGPNGEWKHEPLSPNYFSQTPDECITII